MAESGKLFLKLIAQNPFRILGVYSNTSQKDILANANKIKAFCKVGKSMDFSTDNLPDYPKVERTVETVNSALKTLDFDAERFKASLFWFSNSSPLDMVPLKYIDAGNIDKAISIWSKVNSVYSLHNRTIAAAIKNDWILFSTSASMLFDKFSKQLCELFGSKKEYSSEELIKIFLSEIGADNPLIINELYKVCPKAELLSSIIPDSGDVEIYEVYLESENRRMKFKRGGDDYVISFDPILRNFPDEYILSHRDEFIITNGNYLTLPSNAVLTSDAWVNAIYSVLGERLISKAETLITEVHSIDKRNGDARKVGAIRLLDLFRGHHFSKILDKGLDRAIRGKIVKEAIDCIIDFYNNADDQDEIVEEACNLAFQIRIQARHTMHVKRVQENYLKLREHVSKLPPKEIKYYQTLLEERIKKYDDEPSTIKGALRFISDCAPYLMSIKSEIGESHDYYIKVSTRVAASVVNDVIDDFNKQSDDILPRVRNVSPWERKLLLDQFKELVKSAATAMYQLTFFGMDEEFKSQRFQRNYDVIKQQAIDSNAVEVPTGNQEYSVVVEVNGKFKSKKIKCFEDLLDEIDIRNEKEYFDSCQTVKDCKEYLRIFPGGKYESKIDQKIEECEFNSCSTFGDLNSFEAKYPNSKHNVEAKREEIQFKTCRTVNDYKLYISKYPSGRFVTKANERIDDLRFEMCSGRLDYLKYLSDYPKGKHILEAQRKIDDIDFKECSSIDDFERYLRNHPHGCHVREANSKVDDLVFASCSSEQSYVDYITRFPSGNHIGEAKVAIEDYKLWKECDQKKSRALYKEYITRFPKGIHRSLADKRLKSWWRELLAKILKNKGTVLFIAIVIAIIIAIGLIWGSEGYKVTLAIIGGIAVLGAFGTFSEMFSGEWKPFVLCLLVAGIGLGGSYGWEEYDRYQERQNKIADAYNKALNEDNINSYSNFLYDYPDAKQAAEIRSILYGKCRASGWEKLIWFAAEYHDSDLGNKAYNEVKDVCDSIFNSNGLSSLSTSQDFISSLDSIQLGYSSPLINYIENLEWENEDSAWRMAVNNNTVAFYNKFIEKYPYSSHVSAAEKRIIDLEVNSVFSGSYDELPSMNRSGYYNSSTSTISIYNNTGYTLTVMYSGKDSKKVVLSPHGRTTVTLPNGNYKCVASISGNARNHAGTENLRGGAYEVEYYIISSSYPSYRPSYKPTYNP